MIRETKREGQQRGDRCDRKFQECDVPADVYLFSHSMYYIAREQLAVIPVGSIVLASHHVYRQPGTYAFGEVVVTGTPEQWTVRTRGNDLPYVHPEVWLTSESVIDTGYSIIAFSKIREIDTAMAFRGVVRPRNLRHLLSDPVLTPHEPIITDLMQFIKAEAAGVSITPRMVHTLQLRARSWCTSKDIIPPDDIDNQVLAAIKMGMATTEATWGSIEYADVERVNKIISDFTPKDENLTTWQRAGRILWSITGPIRRPTVCVMSYVWMITTAQMIAAAKSARVRIVGGLARLRAQYALAKQKEPRWFTSSWFPVPTCIPANVPENELASIFMRAIPPDKPIKVPQIITEAADLLARKIGKIEAPLDIEEWLSRFDAKRREQLREAGLKPPNALVEFFQKIEQLDECKHPRAIQARVDEFKYAAGPWIAALEHRCREQLPIFIKGLPPEERALKIHELNQRALTAFELDFKRFDRSLSTDLLKATEHRIYNYCLPPEIAKLMTMQLTSKVRTRNNACYIVDGTRMSGDVNTSIGNCLIVACAMLAMKLPLDSFLVEGDDMLAVITDAEKNRVDLTILEELGLGPKPKFIDTNQAEFCSRKLIPTINGPRLCRDPRREISRTGFSIHSETDKDKLIRGVNEWQGIPMLGPMYEELANLPITRIIPEARIQFETAWGISQDEQQKFEKDPIFRAEYAWEIAQPYAPPTRDRYCPIQGAAQDGDRGNVEIPVCPGEQRPGTPGCPGPDVRDVQAEGTSESPVSGSSGDDSKRGGSHRSRLRRKRRDTVVRRHRCSISEEYDSSVEGQHSERTSQSRDEAKVARHRHRHHCCTRRVWRPKQL